MFPKKLEALARVPMGTSGGMGRARIQGQLGFGPVEEGRMRISKTWHQILLWYWSPAHGSGWLFIGALAALLLLLPSPSVQAQDRDRLFSELERTEQVIEKARDVVSSSQNSLAVQYLEQAVKLQNLARNALSISRFSDAARLTKQARDRAFTAIRIADQTGNAEFLYFMIERTDAILDRVAPLVRESQIEISHRMLDDAFEQQRRAREALSSGRPRAAISLTSQARERAFRALRRSESGEGRKPERATRVVERTEDLLRDAAWLGEGDDAAARAYESALTLLSQARGQLEAGQHRSALRLAQQARDQLVRGLNQADKPLAREQVAAAVERSRNFLERAADRIETEQQQESLTRAARHQRKAKEHLKRDRLAACLAEVRAVRNVLERAGL